MTIKEFAQEQGLSTQAVYQRLKKNKIRVEAVTEKGSGEITSDGKVILDKLFDPENRQTKPPKDDLIEALEAQVEELRIAVSRKEERIKSLEEEAGELKKDKEYFKQALDTAQNNLAAVKILLSDPEQQKEKQQPASPRKLTWRERISGKIDSSFKG